MWPLGGLSMIMFFLIFHCWQQTRAKLFCPATVQKLHAGLTAARQQGLSGPQLEQRLADLLYSEEAKVAQWIQYLNVIATVAPMVGLLGTVSGMISAFQTIAAGGMGKPELLAGDIGEALITTATGLVIGIPAMVAYFACRNRLQTVLQTVQLNLQGGDPLNCTKADTAPASSASMTHSPVPCQ